MRNVAEQLVELSNRLLDVTDDPEFRDFTNKISDDLFALTRNVARLSTEVSKLGTKHETARVRERVKSTVEETSEKFKEIGEGVKKISQWPDVGVCGSHVQVMTASR